MTEVYVDVAAAALGGGMPGAGSPDADQARVAIADPEATIEQFVQEMFARFVRGEGDIDAEWDQYVATLEGMGLPDYLRVYQEAYEAKYGG